MKCSNYLNIIGIKWIIRKEKGSNGLLRLNRWNIISKMCTNKKKWFYSANKKWRRYRRHSVILTCPSTTRKILWVRSNLSMKTYLRPRDLIWKGSESWKLLTKMSQQRQKCQLGSRIADHWAPRRTYPSARKKERLRSWPMVQIWTPWKALYLRSHKAQPDRQIQMFKLIKLLAA